MLHDVITQMVYLLACKTIFCTNLVAMPPIAAMGITSSFRNEFSKTKHVCLGKRETFYKRCFTRANRTKDKPTVPGGSSLETEYPYSRMPVTETLGETIPVQNGARLSWDRSNVRIPTGLLAPPIDPLCNSVFVLVLCLLPCYPAV